MSSDLLKVETDTPAQTILLVEDSPSAMQFMQEALEGKGYKLLKAKDGEEALLQTAAHHPDLVLLDVVLPKVSGFEVCREIKRTTQSQTTRVILLSTKNQETDRFWGLKQGADEYLAKPFSAQQLLAKVKAHLTR
ncbi:MAG: response regulator transcription factor [Bryobacteraceae bacterium]